MMPALRIAPVLFLVLSALGLHAIDEGPKLVKEVIFKNAHHVSQKDMGELTGVKKDQPLDVEANRAACVKIQDYLKKKGRYWAIVELEEGDKLGDLRVVFNVKEGPLVRVRGTEFAGNKAFTTQQLRDQLIISSGGTGVLSSALIENDITGLENYYRSHGYRDVKVNREVMFSKDQTQVDVVYHVHEGAKHESKADAPVTSATPPPLGPPSPGFLRLPAGDVPSDFPSVDLGPRRTVAMGRTKIAFAQLDGVEVELATMDSDREFGIITQPDRNWAHQESEGLFECWAQGTSRAASCPAGDISQVGSMNGLMHAYSHKPGETVYSLRQGRTYQVLLKHNAHRIYATLEILAHDGKWKNLLARNPIPIELTNDDVKTVLDCGSIVKIAYLAENYDDDEDAKGFGIHLATHENADAIGDAEKRGTVVLVLRMGMGRIFAAALGVASPSSSHTYPKVFHLPIR